MPVTTTGQAWNAPPGAYLMGITAVPEFFEPVGYQRAEPPEVGVYIWKPID